MNDQDFEVFNNLTKQQREQLVESIGLKSLVSQWRAEDLLKSAKRRFEATSSRLNSEQAKFDQIKGAEQIRFEARLATFRKPLDAAEAEHFEALAALKLAEQELQALG